MNARPAQTGVWYTGTGAVLAKNFTLSEIDSRLQAGCCLSTTRDMTWQSEWLHCKANSRCWWRMSTFICYQIILLYDPVKICDGLKHQVIKRCGWLSLCSSLDDLCFVACFDVHCCNRLHVYRWWPVSNVYWLRSTWLLP